MPIISANDLDIYYEIHGEGPPVVNISGTGGDLRRMPPTLNPLTKHFTVLSYDQRGLGQTTGGVDSGGDAEWSMTADYADDAAALLAVLGWERAGVVGTSFGGMVASTSRSAIRSWSSGSCCAAPHPAAPIPRTRCTNSPSRPVMTAISTSRRSQRGCG